MAKESEIQRSSEAKTQTVVEDAKVQDAYEKPRVAQVRRVMAAGGHKV